MFSDTSDNSRRSPHSIVIAHGHTLPLCELMHPAHGSSDNATPELWRIVMNPPPFDKVFIPHPSYASLEDTVHVWGTFFGSEVSVLAALLVHAPPQLLHSKYIRQFDGLHLPIVASMNVVHPRWSAHILLFFLVGIDRVDLAQTLRPSTVAFFLLTETDLKDDLKKDGNWILRED